MPTVTVTVHPMALAPLEAVRAYVKNKEQDMSLDEIIAEGDILNYQGEVPGKYALWSSIKRVQESKQPHGYPTSNYNNCGRHKILSDEEERRIVSFVKTWRNKRFCTCKYIRNELRLKVTPRTVNNILNNQGYYWRKVPKVQGLTKEQLCKRREFVDRYGSRTPGWWEENMQMVLDGVTLTMPPKPLAMRQKHAAQRITSMWLRDGEALDNDLHTFNRYGVQLGTKVPLWGGFSGNGQFTLRLWTPQPKMKKEEWAALVPEIKAAMDDAYDGCEKARPKVWHDNERFLLQPDVYKANGLHLHRFPPNSGDLNPIETVWAWLRKDLAKREMEDNVAKRFLTPAQFRQRAAQILNSYAVPRLGERYSSLQKLVRGMPKRLRRCKANNYGKCGK